MIWWLLVVPVPFLVVAVWQIRGGLADDDAWWAARFSPMPAGSIRGPVIDVEEAP